MHIPPDGARVTDIADLAAITKQSAGQMLRTLSAWDLVNTVTDPADGRVKLTRRTDLGDQLCVQVDALIAGLEDRWRSIVGAADYETMRRALEGIITAPN